MTRRLIILSLVFAVSAPALACFCFALPAQGTAMACPSEAPSNGCCCETEVQVPELPQSTDYVVPGTVPALALALCGSVTPEYLPLPTFASENVYLASPVSLRGSPPLYLTHQSFLI